MHKTSVALTSRHSILMVHITYFLFFQNVRTEFHFDANIYNREILAHVILR